VTLAGRLRRALGRAPGILAIRRRLYERSFARRQRVNMYRGVFDSFGAAARSAPPTKPLGYDNPAAAEMYDEVNAPTLRDYPALFWLQRAVAAGQRAIFDLGGHVGIKYYAFRDRLAPSEPLRWQVCDVPAVVARGAQLAAAREAAEQLRFTSEWRDIAGADVVFASGSVQYLETPIGTMLAASAARPSYVIINNAALHPSRSFFTLNSIGVAFCPYRVQSEPELSAEIEALGYRRVDRWETPRTFRIPFEPDYDMDYFVGLVFERITR
jgi:putative methyltransferase (TIGR04325 family)